MKRRVITRKLQESRGLDDFFKPRSVAMIGLSRDALRSPNSVLGTLKNYGYQGRIYIINPNATRTEGDGILPTVRDLPDSVDLAIILVPRTKALDALRDCVNCGISSAIIITQGFADADEEGARIQDQISQLVQNSQIRIVGPNTIGITNAFSNFTSSFIEVCNNPSPVGLISQSGLFMMGHHIINNEPAGYGMAVDLGNACDVGLLDILEYYGSNEHIEVVQIHVESIAKGRDFIEVASRINRLKPIVIFKAGTSDSGQKAIVSHSGAAAGDIEVYQAAFRKAGLVVADSAEDLRLLTKVFRTYEHPKGRRVAIMSFSGGGAILAVDALEAHGLSLADLSARTKEAVANFYPSWMDVGNPLDIWMAVSKDFHRVYPKILELLLEDDKVDAVICIYPSFNLPKYDSYDSSQHIRRLSKLYQDKPLLCWSYGLDVTGFTRSIETDSRSMVFPSLGMAARALDKLAAYREFQERELTALKGGSDAAFGARLSAPRELNGDDLQTGCFNLLESRGIPIAGWRLCRDEQELSDVPDILQYPLCMKIVSPDILHKSDVGGVRLDILTKTQLLESYREMIATISKAVPAASILGVLVQEMVPKGKEVMIGVKRDESFGHCLVFGAGGIYTEQLADYSFRITPVDLRDAYEMIEEVRISRILKGVRGEAPCNLASLADVLTRVSALICNHPEISELDLNPIIATKNGVVVVDARIIL